MREIIYDNMMEVAKRCSIIDMYERIKIAYPKIEINKNTISTQMSDLSINGPDSSQYPMHKRFLKRVGIGVYEITKEQNFMKKQEIVKSSIPKQDNQKTSQGKWKQNKITIMGEPYTFATKGEIPWRQTISKTLPEKFDGMYSGVELKFHYVPQIHGQPLDVDNLCEPVFTVLVGEKKYFGGTRNNIEWFKAEKIPDTRGKLELNLSEKISKTSMNLPIFDENYDGKLPKSATDKEFAKFVENNTKKKLKENDECCVRIQFNSKNVNLGNISSGTIKPIIDCLYPVLGGNPGDPNDHTIRILQVEKGINSVPQNNVRIVVSIIR